MEKKDNTATLNREDKMRVLIIQFKVKKDLELRYYKAASLKKIWKKRKNPAVVSKISLLKLAKMSALIYFKEVEWAMMIKKQSKTFSVQR